MPEVESPPFPELLAGVPELGPVYDEHIEDNDELLSHVLMADVTRFFEDHLTASYGEGPEAHRSAEIVNHVLTVLEDAMMSGDPGLRELVSASFLENLDQDERYEAVKELAGPGLKRQLEVVEKESP